VSSSEGKEVVFSDDPVDDNLPLPWTTVAQIVLYKSDRDTIGNEDGLTDKHIHAAQFFLKQQHPNISELQDPILQVTSSLDVQSQNEFA